MTDCRRTFEKPSGLGSGDFLSWEKFEREYVVDDSIVIEAHVKIIKMTGKLARNL